MKQKSNKPKLRENVYVVTRRGRRVEPDNYQLKEEAQVRAQQLFEQLKQWKDPDRNKITVIETSSPHKIY
jgi:hypothetical protein